MYDNSTTSGLYTEGELAAAVRTAATRAFRAGARSARADTLATVRSLVGAGLSLAATSGPDDDPSAKATAFNAITQNLSRNRKATVAQLLALAMIRVQQRATAAGKPGAAAGSLSALSELAGDPVQVARIVGMKLDGKEMSALELAWHPVTTVKDTQAAESDDIVDPKTGNPKRLYGKAAQAALASQQRRMDRADAEKVSKEIIKRVAKGKATPEEVQQLAKTLPALRNETLTKYRGYVEANLRGERKKQWMVERLLDHIASQGNVREAVPKEVRVPESARGASRNPSKSKYAGTVTQSVMDFGGIDPNDSYIVRELGGVKGAVEHGIPLLAFRGKRGRGTRGLDELAQELAESGHITIPEDAHSPEEYLLEQIIKGAKANGEERTDQYDEYLKAQKPEPVKLNDKGYPADWDTVEEPAEPATKTDAGDVAEVVSGTDTDKEPGPVVKVAEPPAPEPEPTPAPAPAPAPTPAPAPKTGADRIAALKAKQAGRVDAAKPKDVPAPVAAEVEKQAEAPAPAPAEPKQQPAELKDRVAKVVDRRKRTGADADPELNKLHAGINYNMLLDAARSGEAKREITRIKSDALAAVKNLPDEKRAKWERLIAEAAKGRGKELPPPSPDVLKWLARQEDAGPVEDVDPTEALPTEADDKAGDAIRAALKGGAAEPGTVGAKDLEAMDKLLADAPDPDEEPEVAAPTDESGIERKARLADEEYQKALALFNNPATPKKDRPGAHTIKKLLTKRDEARQVVAAEARRTGKPSPVAGILAEEKDRLARMKALKVTDTPEALAARERARKANAQPDEPDDEPAPPVAPPPEPPKKPAPKPAKPKKAAPKTPASTVKALAETFPADSVERDFLESALHNHDAHDPKTEGTDHARATQSLAEQLGLSVEEGFQGRDGKFGSRTVPDAAHTAVRRALAAMGAQEQGAVGEQTGYNRLTHQHLPNDPTTGTAVRVVRPPMALNGRVVLRGVVEPA